MAQSVFAAEGTQFIDAVDQAFAPAGAITVGVEFLGGSKAFVRRGLARFNVAGAAQSGRPLTAGDAVVAAELVLVATAIAGPAGWAGRVERISRADWDYTTANWNRYRTGFNWTNGGADVATPPAHVAFTSPSLAGEHVIAGMAAHVADGLANRGGAVLLRVRADDEAPAQSQWCAYDASPPSSLRPRLRVTYVSAEAAPIAASDPPTQGERVAPAEGPAAPDGAGAPERAARPEAGQAGGRTG